jgi:hypothetical protein
MPLNRVRLELAREPGHPAGSPRHGYELIAPLDEEGRLDIALWNKKRQACTVHRFWEGEGPRAGHLTHIGGHWRLHYPGEDADEDDPIYKLASHIIKPGEYISIDEDDGERHTFKIVVVEPV